MNLQCIDEHTIDLDLLTGGIVIDAGCVGWTFSKEMVALGESVIAFDLEDLQEPTHKIAFLRYALGNDFNTKVINMSADRQAWNVVSDRATDLIKSFDYHTLMYILYVDKKDSVDIVKLDIEGSEYEIFSIDRLKPIPKQISIEFHAHAHPELHEKYYEKCMDNLLKWYEPVQHEWTSQHGAGFNYWDSLFIRKDLI